jgi:hypothetical protein
MISDRIRPHAIPRAFARCWLGIALAAVLAATVPAAALDIPALTGRVVDEAGILDGPARSALAEKLAALEAKTTDQLVVVTLKSLQGISIEDFAVQLGRSWKIGQKDKNNGVLLIVAPNERKVRIEVGYGLEGKLTDTASKLIIENSIIPRFKASDFPGGIGRGVDDIISALTADRAQTVTATALAVTRMAEDGDLPANEKAVSPCKSDTKAAFVDDFKTEDDGWNLTDKTETYYADGQLAIKAEANTTWAVIYRPLFYTNATVCLDLKSPTSVKERDRPSGGLIFWALDYRNYYVVLVYPDGGYLVSRKIAGNWATISSRKKNEAVNAGLGAVNQIKVTTIGHVASVFINGRKIQDLKGQPLKTGGSVGVFGESEKKHQNEWRYLDIMVTELPENAPVPAFGPADPAIKALLATCKAEGKAVFADDFKAVDTGWIGVPSDNAVLADGQLRIKAAVNSSWRTAYWSLIYKDITVCTDVKSPTEIKDADDTCGGVVFWGTDFDNYYSVSVYPDGSYSIDRRVSGSIIKIKRKAAHASVNKGPEAENRVKVVVSGSTGTLYINDVKAQEFRGQPPPNGSAVGLFGESETHQRDEWGFSNFLVVDGS